MCCFASQVFATYVLAAVLGPAAAVGEEEEMGDLLAPFEGLCTSEIDVRAAYQFECKGTTMHEP